MPSPHADAMLVLLAAKQQSLPWVVAWKEAMRALQPPRDAELVAELMAADRELLREIRPIARAAYEDRQPTEAERRRAEHLADRRLADTDEARARAEHRAAVEAKLRERGLLAA